MLAGGLTGAIAACAGPLEVAATQPAGTGEAEACRRLVDALPESVADQPRREVSPADVLAAAWGDPPIVLRCGVPLPTEYADARICTTVNGIDWFIPPTQLDSVEPVDLTMTTVTREPHVEIRMPKEYAPQATTLVDVGPAVEKHSRSTGPCG